MNDQSTIERVVMRRVRFIRILALVISTVTLAVLTVIAALWGIGKEVWVAKVFENGPQGFFGRVDYLWYAFLHTRLIVQALSLLTATSFLFLLSEAVRYLFSLASRNN